MKAQWLVEFEKQFGKGVLVPAAEIQEREYRTSGSIALDVALGGGWPKRGIVQLFGKEGSGKTLLFDLAAVEAQRREGKRSLIFDFEGTYDTRRFAQLGGDLDMLDVITHDHFKPMLLLDPAFDMCKAILNTSEEYACIAFDSTGAMVTIAEFEKRMEKGQEASAPMLTAKAMSDGLRILIGLIARNEVKPTVFFVSQGRDNIGGMTFRGIPPPDKQTGGRALPYYATTRVEVKKGELYKGDAEELELKGIEIGHVTKVTVKKNKANATQGRSAQFDVYNLGDIVGIDRYAELAQLSVYARQVDRMGAYYVYGDRKFHGMDAFKAALVEDESLFADLDLKTRAELARMMDLNRSSEEESDEV
jgi:recombination protein RecA